jgi:hypothetical protein
MLVTNYYHPRSLPHSDAIDEIETAWPEDSLPGTILEGYDHDDLMGGSPAGLYYSSEEGEGHTISVWHAPKGSDISEEESNQEESDHPEFNYNAEGNLDILEAARCVNCVHSNGALGKAPQVGDGRALWGTIVIQVCHED